MALRDIYRGDTVTYTFNFRQPSTASAEKGQVVSATPNTLVDDSQTWTDDEFAGRKVKIIGGSGKGESITIFSNTANMLVLEDNWQQQPDENSIYNILAPIDITGWTLWFGLKTSIDDPDTEAVIQVQEVMPADANSTGGLGFITLSSTDTDVEPATYHYGLQRVIAGSPAQVTTLQVGKLKILKEVNRDVS